MSLSDAMLAQALLEYLQQNATDFGKFLCDRCNFDGYVGWSENPKTKRLMLTVMRLAQDGEPLSERSYSISIETIDAADKPGK